MTVLHYVQPCVFHRYFEGKTQSKSARQKKNFFNKIIAHLISLVAHLNINEYRGYAGDNLHDISMCAPRNGLLEL